MNDLYLFGGSMYPGLSPMEYGLLEVHDPNESEDERLGRMISTLLGFVIGLIGVPILMGVGYLLYKLITLI